MFADADDAQHASPSEEPTPQSAWQQRQWHMFEMDDDNPKQMHAHPRYTPEQALVVLENTAAPLDERIEALVLLIEQFEAPYFARFYALAENPQESTDVRGALMLALAKMAHESDVDALRENVLILLLPVIQGEASPLRPLAIEALGRLHLPEALATLVNALNDPDGEVFSAAAEALGQMGHMAQEALLNVLTQGADDARCVAAWKLGELGHAAAVPALAHAVQHDPSEDVVALAIWALGEIGTTQQGAIEALEWARAQASPALNERAKLALKKVARHLN